MSTDEFTAKSNERIFSDPAGDPAVVDFCVHLRVAVKADLIEASRAAGVVPTAQTAVQAEMLASIATQVLMRHIKVLRARCTEGDATIEAWQPDPAAPEYEQTFDGAVALPELMAGLNEAMIGQSLVALDKITGEGATSFLGTAFVVSPHPIDAAKSNPPVTAARLVMPTGRFDVET